MEDLTPEEGTPTRSPIPQAGDDPDDPHRPELNEDQGSRTPPISAPQQDMDVFEEKEEMQAEEDPEEHADDEAKDANDDLSDDESVLSEIDEAQFEDFDPAAIAIEERPVPIDESNVNLLQSHKRKRTEGEEEEEARKKKKKEGKRPKKPRKTRDDEDGNFEYGQQIEGKRVRKPKEGTTTERSERPRPRKAATPENEEDLTPEERRRRALDKAMDEALKPANKRRRKKIGEIDLEKLNDDLIEEMRTRMTEAAKADHEARTNGQPAMEKLKLLPEVIALLNRNNLKDQLVDPDTNLLEAVRFFLEPLNDGSLPAYNIQRELFDALDKLTVTKEALIASGIGKVTIFYTKSKKIQVPIKRIAERLIREWSRPILKRSDDFRKRELKEAQYDPTSLPVRTAAPSDIAAQAQAAARERKLAAPIRTNRARVETSQPSYTVVPRSVAVDRSHMAANQRRR